jgi:hypothetical protein
VPQRLQLAIEIERKARYLLSMAAVVEDPYVGDDLQIKAQALVVEAEGLRRRMAEESTK